MNLLATLHLDVLRRNIYNTSKKIELLFITELPAAYTEVPRTSVLRRREVIETDFNTTALLSSLVR